MDVLKNKQYKSYDKLSRYTTFPIYYHTIDNKYVYGTTNHLLKNITYTLYKVKKNDTWDSIALEAYNNPVYYWIICDFNDIQDPFIEPEPDTYVKVPVLSLIRYHEVI